MMERGMVMKEMVEVTIPGQIREVKILVPMPMQIQEAVIREVTQEVTLELAQMPTQELTQMPTQGVTLTQTQEATRTPIQEVTPMQT